MPIRECLTCIFLGLYCMNQQQKSETQTQEQQKSETQTQEQQKSETQTQEQQKSETQTQEQQKSKIQTQERYPPIVFTIIFICLLIICFYVAISSGDIRQGHLSPSTSLLLFLLSGVIILSGTIQQRIIMHQKE